MKEFLVVLLPGMMYFWVLFIGQSAMQEVLQDKENHILSRILASPVTLSQFLFAKMLRCFLLCSFALVLLLLLTWLIFGIHWGNPLLLLIVVAASAFSMTGLLSLVYSAARTKEQANGLSSVLLLTVGMLGGSMFPYENLPSIMRWMGQMTPNRWCVLAIHQVVNARPLAELVTPLAGLAALGVVGSVLAVIFFRKQLAQGR